MEKNFDFLKRMRVVHQPNRRDWQQSITVSLENLPEPGEILLDNSWKIVIPTSAGQLIRRAADDFQDYLFTSMNVSVPVLAEAHPLRGEKILLLTADASKSPHPDHTAKRGQSHH